MKFNPSLLLCGLLSASGLTQEPLLPQGEVHGRVTDEKDQPVSGASLRIYSEEQSPLHLEILSNWDVETNTKGEYVITRVRAGTTFSMYFSHPSRFKAWKLNMSQSLGWPIKDEKKFFTPYFVTVKRHLRLKEPQEKLTVDAQLLPVDMSKLVATGHVTDTKGKPFKFRQVIVMAAERWLVAYTDGNGDFQIHGLPVGNYEVVLPHRSIEAIQKPLPRLPTKALTVARGKISEVILNVDQPTE